MEEVRESLERMGNSITPTQVDVSELKEEEEAQIINQATLGHLLRIKTVQRCKGQSSTTYSSGRASRIECIPATSSIDVYKNWPLEKHDECWVERIHNLILLVGLGKKQQSGYGTIESHVNGFTYSDHGDCDQVFMHDDVEWYFYQLGNRWMPPLMQFHLKHPVKIRNTETKDIQFLLMPKVTSDNRKTRFTSRFSRFRRFRRFIRFNIRKTRFSSRNKDLKKFVHKVQETQFACESKLPFTGVEFQALDEFQFCADFPTGVRTVCAMTSYNLVVFKDLPFLVVQLWDIQIVNLACIELDEIEMTVIFKDLECDVLQLRSISLEFLAGIKDRLNRDDVKYYVNSLRLNWSDIVKEIRESPETFIAKGGWDIFEDSVTLAYYPLVDSYLDLDSESVKTNLGEIPDEFLDPIQFTLMEDPVILPSSRITVDRPVIQRFLGDNHDPFDRSPLTQDMLIPDVDMKARIEEFIKSQGSKKHSSEGLSREAMQTETGEITIFE